MNVERTPRATVFGSYGYGWQQFRKHFLYLFLIGLIVGIATAPATIVGGDKDHLQVLVLNQILVAAYMTLLLPVIKYGAALMNLRYVRNDAADIKDIFSGFRKNYLNIILANLLVVAVVGMGFVLLIVPGIILACRLSFVPYLVMDKDLDPVAAVEKSWNMTRGHGFRIFGMFLMSIPVVLLGMLLLFVGVFFSFVWVAAAFASFYHAVDLEEQRRLDANGTAQPGLA